MLTKIREEKQRSKSKPTVKTGRSSDDEQQMTQQHRAKMRKVSVKGAE